MFSVRLAELGISSSKLHEFTVYDYGGLCI